LRGSIPECAYLSASKYPGQRRVVVVVVVVVA
jgi:hypothetical protein